MSFLDARVGETVLGEGAPHELRLGRLGDAVVNVGGQYYEAARKGRVFHAARSTGFTFGTSLTATAVTLTLYNPASSPVDMVVVHTTVLPAPGAVNSCVVYAVTRGSGAEIAIPTSVTEVTVVNGRLGLAAGYGKAYSAATLPATPTAARVHPGGLDFVEGAIVLSQNTSVTLQGVGTIAQNGIMSAAWMEIPS